MKLLAISEHYFPRLGGTVSYLHETLSALVRRGVEVELWVPGPEPESWKSDAAVTINYTLVWIDAGYPTRGDPSRAARYKFCIEVNKLAQKRARGTAPDVIHTMFGLFVMEHLDTDSLREAGLPSVVTVHNVPPNECRLVTNSAPMFNRLMENIRLHAVSWKNRARLRAHCYDAVIVPSRQVHDLLEPILKIKSIQIIGHGPTQELLALMEPPSYRAPKQGSPVRILTVGGYAPHKRQHIIPEVAAYLCKQGIDFQWDVVGPAGRIAGYYEGIEGVVSRMGIAGQLRICRAVPLAELAKLYDDANLYVQPSVEEGFCITALDAAASGLPVIASPAGALARIADVSGGDLVESNAEALADAIGEFVRGGRWRDARAQAESVCNLFSWDKAACSLIECYESVMQCQVSSDG